MNKEKFGINYSEKNRFCSHSNKITFGEKTFCVDCEKEIAKKYEEDKDYCMYRRKKVCSKGIHNFISKDGDVYCRYCGEIKENIGFSSVASGNIPLKRGKFEEGIWGK